VKAPFPPALLLILVFAARAGEAQEPPRAEEGPGQVPRRIFVGDRGRLILSPGPGFEETPPFTLSDPRLLPQGPDLKILRLEFRRIRDEERLLIDFIAFAPGRIALPPLDLPQMPGLVLDYEVEVASILGDSGVLALSAPAPPLAAPGTAFLIYGTASLIVLALLLGLVLALWGRPYLAGFLENHRRRRLVRLMGRVGKRLRESAASDSCRGALRELSAEFRAFLGYFFDRGQRDCRAMTASEFLSLPPLFPPSPGDPADSTPPWAERSSPPALGSFLRLLDRLRYSGEAAGPPEISALFDRLDLILGAMDEGFRSQGKSAPGRKDGHRL
jgi:hypothetical protein